MSLKTFRSQGNRQSMALVVTLAIVAIVSLLLVSFVTSMQSDRIASFNYGQSAKAEQLAQGGLKLVVGELTREMSKDAGPVTVGNYSIYTNVTAINLLPQRVGTNSAMPNLVKISTNAPGFAGSGVNAGMLMATAISTTSPSQNLRSLSLTRWGKPRLGSFPNNVNAPYWILVTRQGATNAAGVSPLLGPVGATLNNPSLGNLNYAIGRFAYAIYDEGGLLNINVAGYPTGAASYALKKGSAVWADLSIPELYMGSPQTFVQWRNASTALNFNSYVANTWSTNGFMNVASGDMAFINRQDLIQAAVNNQLGLSPRALPFLTTFSRDLNAPSWSPGTPTGSAINYASIANTTSSINRCFPNVRVVNTFTRRNGETAQIGEPLVSQRFPLSKLALVTDAATDSASTDIYRYFGLKRINASNPWVYNHGSPGGGTRIMTLDEVAQLSGANAREPDFFELLKACLLSGSLGLADGELDTMITSVSNVRHDQNVDLQILRIGANIIDQQDADNYPTQITLTVGGTNCTIAGIEDLPYPNKILFKIVAPATAAEFDVQGINQPGLFFELWNPHRAPAVTVPTPTNFRIVANTTGGILETYFYTTANAPNGVGWTNGAKGQLTSTGIPIIFSLPSNQCRDPWVVRGAASGPVLPFPTFPDNLKPNGYLLPKSPPPPLPPNPNSYKNETITVTHNYAIQINDLLFSYQYQDSSGTWKTYATSSGFETDASTGLQMVGKFPLHYRIADSKNNNGTWSFVTMDAAEHHAAGTANSLVLSGLLKSDPRTYRFGWYSFVHGGLSASGARLWGDPASDGGQSTAYYFVNNTLLPTGDPTQSLPAYSYSPFITGFLVYSPHLFSQNTIAAPSSSGYLDADKIQRRGDAAFGPGSSDISYPMQMGGTTSRPVILNRPFQSVGELGYAFRDMPWKTLDLFSDKSADAALLDAFSVEDTPIIAGRVNLNTRNKEVLKALLSGVGSQEIGGTALNGANADAIATAIVAASNPSVTPGPFLNPADLATRLFTISIPASNKMNREVAVRALGSATSTRTWNLMIDIVAQAGKYLPTATGADLDQFLVEGERRYWLHVAIDRYTGQIIDQQLELVNE